MDQPSAARILIVDDEPDSLRFLTRALESAGYTALIARSGEDALDIVTKARPDLVIMDAIMPGMGGFEATRRLKSAPPTNAIPVIFMTGLSGSDDVVEAFRAGAADYVSKPVVIEELLARLAAHLATARQTDRSRDALDAMGRLLVAVDTNGQVAWMTPQARVLLEEMEPGWRQGMTQLPSLLREGLEKLGRGVGDDRSGPVRVEGPDGAIELVPIPRATETETLLRLNDLREAAAIRVLLEAHPLTQREAEVLLWISYGKPNRVISEVLAISPRTVNKHLEQIFSKLGVETRAAAAALAVRTLSR